MAQQISKKERMLVTAVTPGFLLLVIVTTKHLKIVHLGKLTFHFGFKVITLYKENVI